MPNPETARPALQIDADVHDDSGVQTVPFNAAPYFDSLDEQSLFEWLNGSDDGLALPRNDENTDDIARTLKESNPEIADFFAAKKYFPSHDGEGPPEFEVSYNTEDLIDYAAARFPAREAELQALLEAAID